MSPSLDGNFMLSGCQALPDSHLGLVSYTTKYIVTFLTPPVPGPVAMVTINNPVGIVSIVFR